MKRGVHTMPRISFTDKYNADLKESSICMIHSINNALFIEFIVKA